MKEEKDKKHEVKTFYLYTGIVIVVVLSVLLIGLLIYCYWKSKITDEAVGYNPINSVIAFLALILNILTVIFVYATYQTQRDTIKMQAKQIDDSKKDVEYNRALDMIFRQTDLNNDRINELKSTLDILDGFYNIDNHLPKYTEQIRTVILNYLSMSHTIEQFISRTNLDPKDKSYLYLFFEENINVRFKLIFVKYKEQIDKMGNPKSIRETLIRIYNNTSVQLEGLLTLDTYLTTHQYLISMVRHIGEVRARLNNPNHESKAFKFDDE